MKQSKSNLLLILLAAIPWLFVMIVGGINLVTHSTANGQPLEPKLSTTVQTHVVKLKVETEDGKTATLKEEKEKNVVRRSMEVDNPEATLSGICSIIDNIGYMQIYGTISATESRSFWMDTQILRQKYGINKIKLFLNSGGGGAYDGIALADLITSAQQDGFEIEVFASGLVASAAVPIYAACGKRIASAGCVFMVHKAKLFKYIAQESIDDLEAQKEMMRIVRAKYLDILASRSKLTKDDWEKLLEKTTWFTAKQALEWGLIDEIR